MTDVNGSVIGYFCSVHQGAPSHSDYLCVSLTFLSLMKLVLQSLYQNSEQLNCLRTALMSGYCSMTCYRIYSNTLRAG